MHRNTSNGKPCPYCKRTMNSKDFHLRPTWDHVIPVSRGGRAKIVCCNKCNGIKGNMLPDQWEAYMEANPGWWLLSRAERRARNKANPNAVWWRGRQGSPTPRPVVVPPELIFTAVPK